ncbi:uncharacterized protein LOC114928018 [Nylanderia fulva]|uniref:uncharacterized protein LOC114928018 n=1 Tax=Nylanderia fulva TaxID=613905 RepID=UPI0010FAF4ED|nr:uncharacterized protein LOC114928018 [Nylanderia fulva]
MKTCRKSVATVLLLSIHLLMLRIDDVVAEVKPKIILEEVIITGSGNDTRVIANAVAEDVSKIGDGITSLLSKQTSSNLDQDAAQSVNVDVNEDDLERLKRVIAKYEPQRITSRIMKRKIINGEHVLQGKVAGSTTGLERAYDEVLRNISRRAPELTSSNVDATLNPYLSQTRRNLMGIYVPETTIHDDAQKSRSDVDSSPTLNDKKKLLKKYLQLNRTFTIPRGSPELEESRFNEETADESIIPGRYFKVPKIKTKPNESPSNIYSESTEKPERKWNIQDSSFIPRLNNNSYGAFNVNNLNNLNFPSDPNTVQLLSKYDKMPRPFSLLRSPDSPVIEIPYGKPSPSPASLNRQQVARSSTSVLPLILPTETLFDPSSARRYVPIKRANHLKPEGGSFNTEASPANERTTFGNYGAPYIIDTTKSPLVSNQQRIPSANYYAITENPVEQDVTRTNSPKIIHVPGQTFIPYTLQQEKDPQAVRRHGFSPNVAYNIPDDRRSNLNANAGLELYNKLASLYSANVLNNAFNVPKTVTQNYPNLGQHVSTPSYATLNPISLSLPKIRPNVPVKSAPYYDSGLLISQRAEEKELNDNKKHEESVKVDESRAVDKDESNTEAADNENHFINKAPINHGSYKSHKTSNEQHEKKDREEEDKEDRYQQPKHNYDYQDKYQKYNKDDKNNDRQEKYNVRHKDNEDKEEEEEEEEEEKDADETQEGEYVSPAKNQDERTDRYEYNKHKYDRDDSGEEERDKQRYDSKKHDKGKNLRDEHDDDEADKVKDKFVSGNKYFDKKHDKGKNLRDEHDDDEADKVKDKFVSGNKYFDGPRYSDHEAGKKYREPYDRKKARDEDSEDVAEDKLVARRFKDEYRRQRERYEEEERKGDETTQKPKPYRHGQVTSRRDSYREEHPKRVREEYRQHPRQDVEDDEDLSRHRGRDNENDTGKVRDHEHGETQEHAHKHEEHHEKKKDHGGDHKFEEGEGAEHKDEHHGHKGEKGHKDYKDWHEHEKAEKGHHDKEHSSKEYDEKAGEEKKHQEKGGYHKEHHHDEGGKKEAEFGEKGEHKKGHSTHGQHSVHKKDEYEKKTEFFDEFHDDGEVEKHGEHHHEHESKKGGHEKKGHHDAADHEEKHGKKGKHEKGGHHHEHKGHKLDEGHDHHYNHDEKHDKKEGHESGKKWSFKKGDHGGHR